MKEISELDTVALLEDISSHNLLRGDVGTVVAIHSNTDVEVEFIDKNGISIAILALPIDSIMKIRLDMMPA